MKRIFILVAVALLVTGALFADEQILIDFGKLAADIIQNQDGNPTQNRSTLMDYGQVAGGSFTSEQKTAMKTSLAIVNWEVRLTSSSARVDNIAHSYTLEAPSKQWGTVFGVRVHFPVESWNASAMIRPPFEIPAFESQAEIDDDGNIEPSDGSDSVNGPSRFEDGFGVVKNVGTLKAVAINAYGLNFPHGLWVYMLDSRGVEKEIFMGYLNYDGWGELTWNNPSYVQDVRSRELRLIPLYPTATPFVKFNGLRIERDGAKEGGDFIGYFKDVKIIFDKAVLDTDRDIDDESLWNIIKDRETAKKVWEMQRFGHNQILRYLEGQKQAPETSFTPTSTEGAE
ncbi:MAG: flagellar filament outer layer protein FlaA [Treponema sp.]|jgi:hypothetical protein|nr:flagellar filament outer layer protein FlaA [Treponema sp.]